MMNNEEMKLIEDLGELIRDIVDAFKKGFNKNEKDN